MLKILSNKHTLSLLSTGASAIFSSLCFLLIVRTYTKQDMGEWIIYSTGLQLLDMLRGGLLFTSLIKFLSGNMKCSDREEIIGSSWIISCLSTFLIIFLTYILFIFYKPIFIKKGFLLFFQLFPLSFTLQLPVSISIQILISKQRFKKILLIKLGTTFLSFLFLYLNFLIFQFDIYKMIIINALINLPIVIYIIADGSSGLQYIFKASKKTICKLLKYGKFTMLTLLGANLLSSADIYIIGLFLTNIDVANYGVPLKIVKIIEFVLLSFYDVAMPEISKEANKNNILEVRRHYYRYIFFITLFMILIVVLFIAFGKTFLWVVGDVKLLDSPEIYYVLVILIFSFLLHPLDRFSGIILDSINKPGINMFKVFIMVSVNIIGDLIVIILFKSIILVAFITLLNLFAGVVIGQLVLKKQVKINFFEFVRYIKGEIKFYRKSKKNKP